MSCLSSLMAGSTVAIYNPTVGVPRVAWCAATPCDSADFAVAPLELYESLTYDIRDGYGHCSYPPPPAHDAL